MYQHSVVTINRSEEEAHLLAAMSILWIVCQTADDECAKMLLNNG